MQFIILALLAIAAPAEPYGSNDTVYQAAITRGCYANHRPDPAVVRELFEIGRAAGIVEPARGLVAAGACSESGYKVTALGDWKDPVTGKRCANRTPGCVPTSYGMMQQVARPWKKRIRRLGATMREPRFDWQRAARVWSEHVVHQLRRVREECGYQLEEDVWRAAHRTSVRPSKCVRWRTRISKRTGEHQQYCAKRVPRCHRLSTKDRLGGMSRHWRILKAWRGEIETALVSLSPEQVAKYPRAVTR